MNNLIIVALILQLSAVSLSIITLTIFGSREWRRVVARQNELNAILKQLQKNELHRRD